jgi:hypothetical protein
MTLPKFTYIGSRRIKLIEDYKLPYNKLIPKGFESDLGTIPSIFWKILCPKDIKYSAIIHDYEWMMADYENYDYHQSNLTFYKNCLELDKISKWKALICFIVLEFIIIFKKH